MSCSKIPVVARVIASHFGARPILGEFLYIITKTTYHCCLQSSVETRVTFSLGHQGPTRFTNYPSLTRIGAREKRNCSFDYVETYKR